MKTKEFFFNLPTERIAQFPSDKRGESRLLVLSRDTNKLIDSQIGEIDTFLPDNSLLVINNSKVRKARLYGTSESGAIVEFLFLHEREDRTWSAIVSKSSRQKVGKRYSFSAPGQTYYATIVKEEGGQKRVQFDTPISEHFFEECGHVPLPPYIKREELFSDQSRYQTIYASVDGSVAAPTAGLHFTTQILEKIEQKGIEIVPITLHVGLGTFLPVRSEELDTHVMHYEEYEIEAKSAALINRAKQEGRKIVAVGTTTVRTLESAYDYSTHQVRSVRGSTNLFIVPPYKFQVVDHLITNFHTPESTLLVLVSAFATKEQIFGAYHHAIEKEYNFFSYGDAMLIL